jgi:hypothetical protein
MALIITPFGVSIGGVIVLIAGSLAVSGAGAIIVKSSIKKPY